MLGYWRGCVEGKYEKNERSVKQKMCGIYNCVREERKVWKAEI